MEESTSKEKILKRIRKALIHKSEQNYQNVDLDSDIYPAPEDDLEVLFAQRFSDLNGKFLFCENETDFAETFSAVYAENKWQTVVSFEPKAKELLKKSGISFVDDTDRLSSVDVGVTLCECLVARTGTVMVSSKQLAGRRLPAYANYHIVIAYTSQLVYTMKEALKHIKTTYGKNIPSAITAITGPSRTADIEKTLVQGAHGPKDIYVFLIDDTGLA